MPNMHLKGSLHDRPLSTLRTARALIIDCLLAGPFPLSEVKLSDEWDVVGERVGENCGADSHSY